MIVLDDVLMLEQALIWIGDGLAAAEDVVLKYLSLKEREGLAEAESEYGFGGWVLGADAHMGMTIDLFTPHAEDYVMDFVSVEANGVNRTTLRLRHAGPFGSGVS